MLFNSQLLIYYLEEVIGLMKKNLMKRIYSSDVQTLTSQFCKNTLVVFMPLINHQPNGNQNNKLILYTTIQISTSPAICGLIPLSSSTAGRNMWKCYSREDHTELLSKKAEDWQRAITFTHLFIFKGKHLWKGFTKSWGEVYWGGRKEVNKLVL